jgi:Putative 2OG-Fe(II) oxygenase
MDQFLNVNSNYILVKDMSNVIDFDLVNKEFNKLEFQKNTLNQISTRSDFFDLPAFAEAKAMIEQECKMYLINAFQATEFEDLKMTHSWGNRTQAGESHHVHSHPFSIVSGVIYIDDNPENLNLWFESKTPDIPYYLLKSKSNVSLKFLIGEDISLKNHLVLFLSNTEHFVETVTADRRSISFNTFWKGQVGAPEPGLASYRF